MLVSAPAEAIARACQKAETAYLEIAQRGVQSATATGPVLETSGSCAIVLLFLNDVCYVANVGDSRAVMSSRRGGCVKALSVDHKPNEPSEYERIVKHGGTVYQYVRGDYALHR
jgi:protein phosphatase 2C family protein 2/3